MEAAERPLISPLAAKGAVEPPPRLDLSVVVPVYNEVANVEPLVEEIEAALLPTGKRFEIVAVDDGSNDGSREALRALAAKRPHLKVVAFRRNCGQAAAFDAGFRFASGVQVVTMDADLQNDPKDIPAMLAKLDEGYDFVSGWRRKRSDGFLLRTFPSRIANSIIRRATRTQVHDLGCSLKAYRREITDELRLYGEMHRFIAVLADGMGARICEMEVNHRPRRAGQSKYGLARTFKVMLDLLTVLFMRSFQTKPLHVFGVASLFLFAAASIMCGVVLWEKVAEGVWVHRNPLFIIASVCFLVAFQTLGTGLIAEINVRTYFEARQKPVYLVAETFGLEKKN